MNYKTEKRNIYIGLTILLVIIFGMTFSINIKKDLQDFEYDKIFIFAYISNSFLLICFFLHYAYQPIKRIYYNKQERKKIDIHHQTFIIPEDPYFKEDYLINPYNYNTRTDNTATPIGTTNNLDSQLNKDFNINSTEPFKTFISEDYEFEKNSAQLNRETGTEDISILFEESTGRKIEKEEFHSIAIILMIVYYAINVLTLYSLKKTSIFSFATLVGLGVFFTATFKTLFYGSLCNKYKVITLVFYGAAFTLTYFFTLEDFEDYDRMTTLGDILSLCTGFCNAILFVLVEDYCNEYKESFNLFKLVGYIGLYNFLCIPFILIVIMLSGYEKLVLPSGDEFRFIALYSLVISLVIGLSKLYTVKYLGPQVVTISFTLLSPGMLLVDACFGNSDFSWKALVVMLIIIGCVATNLVYKFKQLENKYNKEDYRESVNSNSIS